MRMARMKMARFRGVALTGFFLVMSLFLTAGTARAADDAAAAKAAFKTKCVSCHSADGSGQNAVGKSLNVPDLRSEAVQKKSNDDLAKIIADGKDNMPSFKETSSDAEIKGLVAYIRELAQKKTNSPK
jgi:mono/diheme cytochrome c family protein